MEGKIQKLVPAFHAFLDLVVNFTFQFTFPALELNTILRVPLSVAFRITFFLF